ncbi:hypothetical protein [Mesorhizobium sp. CN2-181]|uniref:hypothetical protein n=1 Tax=Mesorhizobium yinganensis TaxID=3157707 RepID=UPI0032B714D1
MPVPRPTEGARDAAKYVSSLIEDGLSLAAIPFGATVTRAAQSYLERRETQAREILFAAVKEGNIHLLTNPDYEHLIPNIFGYLEAVRRGEYIHNLRILANLFAGELPRPSADPGKVRRAARRLEAMSSEDLNLLYDINAIFVAKSQAKDFDGFHLFVDDRDIVKYRQRDYVSPEQEINSQLADMVSRGLLYIGSNPGAFGGQYYYKTEAFEEIMAAARSIN